MFKVSKLKDVTNEKVIIKKELYEHTDYIDGKPVNKKNYYLSFEITSDEYNFYFETNGNYEVMLNFPMLELVDFEKYLYTSEIFFSTNEQNGMTPIYKFGVRRLLRNKFGVNIKFFSGNWDETYAGEIEFEFDLDDYL